MVKRADRDAPERRCIVTGASGDTAAMIRFVLDPDGVVTPDLEERLPGRGAWLLADRDVMSKAVAKNPFPRAFRTAARLPDQLPDLLTGLLRRRCLDQLGLANGAGQLTAGYEKVREASERGPVGVRRRNYWSPRDGEGEDGTQASGRERQGVEYRRRAP